MEILYLTWNYFIIRTASKLWKLLFNTIEKFDHWSCTVLCSSVRLHLKCRVTAVTSDDGSNASWVSCFDAVSCQHSWVSWSLHAELVAAELLLGAVMTAAADVGQKRADAGSLRGVGYLREQNVGGWRMGRKLAFCLIKDHPSKICSGL